MYALANCERVGPDQCPKHAGTNSFVSFGRISRSQLIRVDFQLDVHPDGSTILVVTAIP